ncbi:MFS transporter, partial [bacterium]|nr:MFS transporter [bacterium]
MKGSPLVVLFLTVFIDLLGFGIVLPLLPYYAESFGAGPLTVTLLSSSYSLMQFLFAPVWGRLSDRVGRRPILVLSLAGSALSYLLFGLAGSLAALFATRLLAGVCAANISTAQAYIADVTTPETRAKGMGMIGAAFGLGFIFGPAAGGALSRYGYAVPAFFAGGLSLLALALALFRLPESLRRQGDPPGGAARGGFDLGRLWAALVHPGMGLLLLIFFCSVFAFANLEATFALFVERAARFGYTARETGYLFAYMGVLMSLMQGGLVGRLA